MERRRQSGRLSFPGVFAQRFNAAGARVGPEFRVNSYTTERQKKPDIAMDPAGNFVVAWQSNYQDGAGYGVFGQRYSASPALSISDAVVAEGDSGTTTARFSVTLSPPSNLTVTVAYGIADGTSRRGP